MPISTIKHKAMHTGHLQGRRVEKKGVIHGPVSMGLTNTRDYAL